MFGCYLDSVTFSSGNQVWLDPNSLIVITGPNNSGKTLALKELAGSLKRELAFLAADKKQGKGGRGKVLSKIDLIRKGTQADLYEWFDENFYPGDPRKKTAQSFYRGGEEIYLSPGNSDKPKPWNGSSALSNFLVKRLDAVSRLELVNPVESTSLHHSKLQELIHVLQVDPGKLATVSDEVKRAFGKEIIINWGGGQQVWLHAGEDPDMLEGEDKLSFRYLRELDKVQKLHEEGEGIRSFVGCLLEAICGSHKFLLIDEPELFLHPPQARRLGQILAESASKNRRQIIVATHSSDFVLGALKASDSVTICRVTREEYLNYAGSLQTEGVQALWSMPVLQRSSAIEGVFHDGVVVCESDHDSRFYERLLFRSDRTGAFNNPTDYHFVHGRSVDDVAFFLRAYRKLDIPTAAIVDFDVLGKRPRLQKLIDSLGGSFADIEQLYSNVKQALDAISPEQSLAATLTNVREELNKMEDANRLSNSAIDRIRKHLEKSVMWGVPKKEGINVFEEHSSLHQECHQLLQKLREIGLWLVPIGELESWKHDLIEGTNKRKWIDAALRLIEKEPTSFDGASKFVEELASFLRKARTVLQKRGSDRKRYDVIAKEDYPKQKSELGFAKWVDFQMQNSSRNDLSEISRFVGSLWTLKGVGSGPDRTKIRFKYYARESDIREQIEILEKQLGLGPGSIKIDIIERA